MNSPTVVSAEVERLDSERVRISWEVEGDGEPAVRILVSDSPMAERLEPLTTVSGRSEAVLEGFSRRWRHYFHVVAGQGPGVVVAERLVPLEGALNFRDLGGYRTADGGHLRWGHIFRADSLAKLSTDDWEHLAAVGLRSVVDFRRSPEIESAPTRPPEELSIRMRRLAIGEDTPGQPELLDLVISGEISSISVGDVVGIYESMVERYPSAFGGLMIHLADDEAIPAVFHCAAGKDRTGIAAALLLSSLGVPDEVVLGDYELSNHYRTARRIEELRPELESKGVDVETVRPYLSATGPALVAAFAWIRSNHGSVEGYLTGPGQVEPDVIAKLRSDLVKLPGAS